MYFKYDSDLMGHYIFSDSLMAQAANGQDKGTVEQDLDSEEFVLKTVAEEVFTISQLEELLKFMKKQT